MVIQGGCVIRENGKEMVDIRINGRKITQIERNITPCKGETVENASGCMVVPGGIDVHTHFDMPAAMCMTADDFYYGTRAAVAGGTTTILDFAEPELNAPLQQGLDVWHEKAKEKSFCDYGFHMTVSSWNETMESQMQSIKEQGITSFKAYTAYQDGIGVTLLQLEEILKAAKKIGAVVCVHCEEDGMLTALTEKMKKVHPSQIRSHPLSRPNQVEELAVKQVTELSKKQGATVYIVHLSTKEGLCAVEDAKKTGGAVYAETCPHYLLLDESKYELPGFEGAKYVMSPPLRSRKDQQALWEGIQNGIIDTLSTDHCAFFYQGQKELGLHDFTKIPNGIPSVEHRMELMYHFGAIVGIDEVKIAKITTENPARIFGMYPQKGTLNVGSDADIVILEHDANHIISKEQQYQKTDYTPYEGMKVCKKVRTVYLRGKKIVKNGLVTVKQPSGCFLKRN